MRERTPTEPTPPPQADADELTAEELESASGGTELPDQNIRCGTTSTNSACIGSG